MWKLSEKELRKELEAGRQKLSQRQIENRVAKRYQEELRITKSPDVAEVVITIQWKKSSTWGNCPRASLDVYLFDAPSISMPGAFYASGCGYCKESTVIAQALNAALRKRLRQKRSYKGAPYGLHNGGATHPPYFSEGVGVASMRDCVAFLGGKWEHVSTGSDFDCYKVTFKKPRSKK